MLLINLVANLHCAEGAGVQTALSAQILTVQFQSTGVCKSHHSFLDCQLGILREHQGIQGPPYILKAVRGLQEWADCPHSMLQVHPRAPTSFREASAQKPYSDQEEGKETDTTQQKNASTWQLTVWLSGLVKFSLKIVLVFNVCQN